ncbi:acyl carrier protein [Nitrosococcus oceani]|uniref:acyl carrier protein n=1 Tax=Nitrosococcus oceani TaxID=1229 RepID=UPI000562612D|nr:phosphopantetheine-binding protein [Nitrosococcus oceani]
MNKNVVRNANIASVNTVDELILIISEILQLSDRTRQAMAAETRLLGAVPEFDSMAVVSIITALEEHYGFMVDDDEVEASTFETVGSLADFVNKKIS